MMPVPVVTRFAPSPTGHLHLGGARTALFAQLQARTTGGRYLLRIEDTDRERSTKEHSKAILESLDWLGLSPDEPTVYQSENLERHLQLVNTLVEQGEAYWCGCSRERLEKLRQEQKSKGDKPRYDGHCRDLGASEGVVRLRIPDDGEVTFKDAVYGDISVANRELDDLVLLRSDGSPTFHLGVVVDDMDMGVTQVVRGDDHLPNVPRQIHIYRALARALGSEIPLPSYAHLPMILGVDGKRLSKRHGAVNVLDYRTNGYLPEALTSVLARLGWSHGDQELFTREELEQMFSLQQVHRAPATLDPARIDWANQQFMQELDPTVLVKAVQPWLAVQGETMAAALGLMRERANTLEQLAELCRPLFEGFTLNEQQREQLAGSAPVLQKVRDELERLEPYTAESIEQVIAAVCEDLQLGMAKVGQPVRLALYGSKSGISVVQIAEILGKEEALKRLNAVL